MTSPLDRHADDPSSADRAHERDVRHAHLYPSRGDDPQKQSEVGERVGSPAISVDFNDSDHYPTTAPTLPAPAGGEATTRNHEPLRIGSYRILGILGEGSMGVVYRAEQENPPRPAALKLLKAGESSAGAMQRLEHEAHMLGLLQHPNIAQIFEAGMADMEYGPQPFFAMELIQGLPLIKYANEKDLNIEQRLRLLLKVCEGVHHAHQKGIIHRDLKPGNIIVDEAGQPKILDFGIALAMAPQMKRTPQQSAPRESMGTIPYMSVEQLRGDPDDIDTRTDVYALGVIAYQLLTGRLPHDVRGKTMRAAAEIIRSQAPPPIGSLDKALRGDLELIVAKAMHQQKEGRYQSATDFARDIRRYLNREAVSAHPPGMIYHFRVFGRRNRLLVGAIAAVFIALSVGMVVSFIMYTKAEREKQTVDAINHFLVNKMLTSADPDERGNPEITVVEVLHNAAESIKTAFPNRPDIKASLRTTIGRAYQSLGQYEQARQQVVAALETTRRLSGEEDPKTLKLMNDLGWLLREQGKLIEAEAMYRRTLMTQRRVLGDMAPDTLETQNNLALVLSKLGKPDDLAEAEALQRHTLEADLHSFGREHENTLIAMNNLAFLLKRQKKLSEAAQLYRKTLAIQRRKLGDGDTDTLATMQNLAYMLTQLNQPREAEQLYREVIETRRRVLGPLHPKTINSINSLAKLLTQQQEYAAAESLYRDLVARMRKSLPPDDPKLASALIRWGMLLTEHGDADDDLARAEPLLRECLAIRTRTYPPGDWHIANAQSALGACLTGLGRFREAEPLLIQSFAVYRATWGDSDEYTERGLKRIIRLYKAWDKPDKVAEYRAMRVLPEGTDREGSEALSRSSPPSP